MNDNQATMVMPIIPPKENNMQDTTITPTKDEAKRNGLATYLGIALIVVNAIITGVSTITDDPDTAWKTGVLATVFGVIVMIGKYAQATAKIIGSAQGLLPIIAPLLEKQANPPMVVQVPTDAGRDFTHDSQTYQDSVTFDPNDPAVVEDDGAETEDPETPEDETVA